VIDTDAPDFAGGAHREIGHRPVRARSAHAVERAHERERERRGGRLRLVHRGAVVRIKDRRRRRRAAIPLQAVEEAAAGAAARAARAARAVARASAGHSARASAARRLGAARELRDRDGGEPGHHNRRQELRRRALPTRLHCGPRRLLACPLSGSVILPPHQGAIRRPRRSGVKGASAALRADVGPQPAPPRRTALCLTSRSHPASHRATLRRAAGSSARASRAAAGSAAPAAAHVERMTP